MSNFPSKEPVLVTCGLPYANGKCHIGHLRTYVPADIFVRALRKQGQEAAFICGSDAHGTPIVVNAEELGITPKELVDKYHRHFEHIFKAMEVEFSFFGNTDSPTNHARAISIVESLIDKGYVYPQVIRLAYCPNDKRFLPDRYVEGICPYCGAVARGDECDQGCGKHLEPGEIKNAKCRICGNPAEYREQEHFFFKLSAFSGFLTEYLKTLGGTANAINYAKEWARELKDWCITRNLEWGVRFPGHDDLVVYVWVDAPIGYISFTEEWAKNTTSENWEKYWRQKSRIIHFIGEDITYHHCIFWPAMLKGAGYTQPWAVVASGMLKIDDKKFSKSRGYVVWVDEDYLDHGFHPDLLRYYIVNYTSHTKELNFSWKVFQEKVNNELVGALGNFLHRTLHFAHKNFGAVPEGEVDKEIFEKIGKTIDSVTAAFDEYEFKKATDEMMELAAYGNSYFQSHEPWQLIKKDREACAHVVKNCLQIGKALVLLFEPILPGNMEKAWRQLALAGDVHTARLEEALVEIPSQELAAPEILFSKIEDKKIKEMEAILNRRIKIAMAKEKNKLEVGKEKAEITFEEFQKLDIRIGKILSAENIKGSDKLLKLEVDIGEKRQIVAGIAKSHAPSELVGRQVAVLANMKPAKLFGVESRGMILAADGEGAVLLLPEKEVKEGTRVR